MSYQITITKITERLVTKNGAYTVIDERPWNKDELANESQYYQSTSAFLEARPVKQIHGYAPPVEAVEKVETQVLCQTVDELDLKAVISAINDL